MINSENFNYSVIELNLVAIAGRKLLPISPPALDSLVYLSPVLINDCIEDMATFTVLAKIKSTECFFNTKVVLARLAW